MTPRISLFLTLLWITAVAVAQPAGFGPESLLDWQFVGDPQISPDGRRIVYVHVSVDRNRDNYDRDLWMTTDGAPPRPLTSGDPDDRLPRWSPDGRRLAFVSKRNGEAQIYVLDLAGGEPWQLTVDAEGVGSFAWSPDGHRIAFGSRTVLPGEPGYESEKVTTKDQAHAPAPPPFVTERLIYRNDGIPGFRSTKHAQLWVVSTEAGPKQTAQRITREDYSAGQPVWSSDGRAILYSANGRKDADYFPDDNEIYSVPSDGSDRPRALTSRRGPDDNPLPSPDGKWIAFTGYDEASPPRSSSVTNLYIMRADGSQIRQLAAGLDRNVGENMLTDAAAPGIAGERIAWRSDSRSVLFTTADRGQGRLYGADVASGKSSELSRFRQGDLREFSVSRNSKVATVFSSPTRPGEIYEFTLSSAGEDGWKLVSSHATGLAPATGFSQYEQIEYESFDGRRIQGWIIKPPGFDAARRYPTILYIHGGPHAMYGTCFFHEFQVLAQSGFVVVITNPRGSTGYGGEFANVIQYHYPGDDYRDLMIAVDQTIANGYVDVNRLGVAGGSGGGLLTSWTVGQTGRFHAAVVERAVTNWYSFVGTSDLNYWFVTHWFREFPWRDSADYLARSPLSYVDKVTTPVLVIHNEQDYRTPFDQGLQYYTALKMLQKPVKLAVFPDSSHGMSREGRPSQRVERLKLITGWFDERLRQSQSQGTEVGKEASGIQ